jgi:hypothetical protein
VCTDTVYHASDVESETLIGGSWPCRLWEVTGDSVDHKEHKHGFRSLTVVGEIEAWRALGPNGSSVATLIERASGITADQAKALDAARGAARDATRGAARVAARVAARDAARGAAGVAARDAAWGAARDAAWGAAGVAAGVAARDAAGALVVRELISIDHFDLLTGPWCAVMGPLDQG